MDETVSEWSTAQRFATALFAASAALATLLSAIGIYGVMSYAMTQQRHEIGTRMALGTSARDVLRLILVQGL